MNCEDISLLLDDRDVGRLTAVEKEVVETHLRRCGECSLAWRVHERLRARDVPEMSADLAQRVRRSFQGSGARPRRRFGRTALLGFALVGATAAMTALQLRELASEPRVSLLPLATEADTARARANDATSIAARASSSRARPVAAPGDAEGGASIAGSPRRRLVVLPTRHENRTTAAVVAVDATYDAIVQFLRSKPDLEVVELTESQVGAVEGARAAAGDVVTLPPWPISVAADPPRGFPPPLNDRPYEGPWIFLGPPQWQGGEDLATARRFGGEYVLRLTNVRLSDDVRTDAARSPDDWSVEVEFHGPQGGGRAGTFASQSATPESVGSAIANRLYASLFPEFAREEQVAVVVDAGAAESARAEALLALSRDRELSAAVIEAAIALGRTAASAETRRQVWELLGRSGNSTAVQPLIDALLFDSAAEVRREAADALFRHLDDPIVRSVLESASINDPAPMVRLQAKWQYMTPAERRAHVAAALRDRSLTPDERLAPLRVARRAVLSFDMDLRLDDELRSLLVAAAREGDAASRKAAVEELFDAARDATRANSASADPAAIDFLVEALADHDVQVRTAAIRAASLHLENLKVRGALAAAHAAETDSQARIVLDEIMAPVVSPPAAHRRD